VVDGVDVVVDGVGEVPDGVDPDARERLP